MNERKVAVTFSEQTAREIMDLLGKQRAQLDMIIYPPEREAFGRQADRFDQARLSLASAITVMEADDPGPAPQSLWLHLVSRHADPMAAARPHSENADQHGHEHDGPGTIRNHPRDDLSFDQDKAKTILEEIISNE